MATYIYSGETVEYANGGTSTIAAGSVVTLATRCGIVGADIAAGETGVLFTEGVFSLPHSTAGAAITLGAQCYWDATNSVVTTTETSNVACGWCVEACAATDAAVKIKLLG